MEANNETQGTPDNATLLNKLKEATEIKTPGTDETKNTQPVKKTGFWSQDDFEPVAETKTLTGKPEATKTEATATPTEPEAKPVSRAVKEAQARITTSSINTLQKLIFEFAINAKTKKRFTPAEQNRLDFISDATPTELTDIKDKNLWLKWDKIMKKRDKKIKKIDMNEEEKRDMVAMFMDYQEASGRVLSPGWGLGIQIADVLAKRAITTFMED